MSNLSIHDVTAAQLKQLLAAYANLGITVEGYARGLGPQTENVTPEDAASGGSIGLLVKGTWRNAAGEYRMLTSPTSTNGDKVRYFLTELLGMTEIEAAYWLREQPAVSAAQKALDAAIAKLLEG
jgi:hypothetical protein